MIPEGGLFNDAIAARLVTQTQGQKRNDEGEERRVEINRPMGNLSSILRLTHVESLGPKFTRRKSDGQSKGTAGDEVVSSGRPFLPQYTTAFKKRKEQLTMLNQKQRR